MATGGKDSQKLHQAADVMEGEDTVGVHGVGVEMLLKSLDGGHEGGPGVDGESDLA